jgi:colanic acid/amylovoran biosynthesis glycosyltransferase
MRVGIAHYSSSSDISGVTSWLISLCHHLVEKGHDVAVHLHHFGHIHEEATILPELIKLNIKVYHTSKSSSLKADIRKTIAFLNEFRPDVFLPQCIHAHYFAATIAGRKGLPWIFTMHSDDPDYWCVLDGLQPWNNKGRVVSVSKYMAKPISEKYPDCAVKVIPYGVAVASFTTKYDEENFRIVYSGRMIGKQKNIIKVVETLIRTCELSTKITAVLIGEGPESNRCKELVASKNLVSRIKFMGRLEPNKVASVLKNCHAIILMSDFEGLPVAFLEGMSHGVVPVARNIESGIPELVEHEITGLLVSDNTDEAARGIVKLSQNRELWELCSNNARNLVIRDYNKADTMNKYMALAESIGSVAAVKYPIREYTLHFRLPSNNPGLKAQYAKNKSQWRKYAPTKVLNYIKNRYKGLTIMIK